MIEIVVATRNKNKFQEIATIIGSLNLIFAGNIPDLPEVVEDSNTLYENAYKKAKEVAEYTGKACLADDTGFFVRALDDRPGIHAAIYAGDGCTYDENVNKLLSEMKHKTDTYAFFKTVCVLYNPKDKSLITAEGILEGNIIFDKRGHNGFGYDPIFIPLNYDKTLAEMSEEKKNTLSHRYKAIYNLLLDSKLQNLQTKEGE
ncbi:MAG: RdgB/HAM1 family non-canonical purine NTP pyrophosphatase [Candidatus Cloacimonetes bacterium]|nr:RdgB/HAM1 family non-canonical purine NTP pyrophosphatase [Candidatus Cloacimonadota bacterium]